MLFILYFRKKKRKNIVVRNRRTTKDPGRFLKIYDILVALPILKERVLTIERKYGLLGERDARRLKSKGAKITFFISLFNIIALGVFYYFIRSVVYSLVFYAFLWLIAEGIIDFAVTSSHNRLLEDFMVFLGYVRQKYYEYGVVDDAIYEATQLLDEKQREMLIQAEIMYDLFLVKDVNGAITGYFETAPNKYLSMFVQFAYVTMEIGDKKVDGRSIFLNNISFLMKNVQIEIDKRKRLNYALKSMNAIVVMPLFFMMPIKTWAISNFAPLRNFYISTGGKYTEILTILLIIGCTLILNKIQIMDCKIKTKSKIDIMLAKINIPMDMKLRKNWFLAMIGALLAIAVFISIDIHDKGSIRTLVYYNHQFLGGDLSSQDKRRLEKESIEDYEFIRKANPNIGDEEIINYIHKKKEGKTIRGSMLEERVARIHYKIDRYHTSSFKLWKILVIFASGFLGYNIARISQKLEKQFQQIEIEDEISGFRSIIMMLMYNERMSVTEVLEWMEQYSVFYKEVITRCIYNLPFGHNVAFEELEKSIENKDMKQLVRQLYLASEDITLQQAFDELEQEKTMYYEERKWLNEQIVKRKVTIGQTIGFIPTYGLIILYLIIPLIYSSITELDKFYLQLQF